MVQKALLPNSQVCELPVRMHHHHRQAAGKWGLTENLVPHRPAARTQRTVGLRSQESCINLHPLIKGVDFHPHDLPINMQFDSERYITESVQRTQVHRLLVFQQDLRVKECRGGVHGEVGDPQGESVSLDRVLKEQLQATAFRGAGDRHVHVVQVELGTPGLQTRLTRLIHVWRA